MKKFLNMKFIVMFILALLWIAPLIFMLSTSFDSEIEAIKYPITLIPEKFSLDAYKGIFTNSQVPILKWYYNSLFVSTVQTGLAVIIYSMAGFAFAKLQFKHRDKLFIIIMMTMMIPAIMNIVPLYLVMDKLHLIGSKWAMILPGLSSAFNVFLMRQFFVSVPDSLMESAYIDGASHFKIYKDVMLPTVKPALIVVGINTFIGSWNEFLWASIVTNDIADRTLPVGLAVIKGSYGGQFAITLALVVVTIIPTIILYIIFQKYLLEGMNLSSGIK